MQRNTRIALLKILVISLVFLSSAPTFSEATPRYQIDIPAQNVEQALRNLANVTNSQLLFPYELVEPLQSTAVAGRYTLQRALNQLLKSTPLSGELTEDGVILVMRRAQHGDKGEVNMNNKINARKTLLATFIAMFATGATAQGVDSDQQAATQQNQIDEIIVTASKRGAGTSIQDTAMAISALSGDTIEKRGLVGMDDYLRTLPGISMQDRGAGQNSIVIRGLSADPQASSSTAGVYLGEVPLTGLGTSSSLAGEGNADIKLVDVERIEVLRGPQGTLYGSDSMGGVVRVLPAKPVLSEMEGSVSAKYSQTGEEGDDNTMLQGMINIPLIEDELAVRVVAYQFDNSGFINNVAASQPFPASTAAEAGGGVVQDRNDVGNDEYTGFRITTLWQPTEDLDITLMHLQQDIEQDGTPEVNLNAAGDYQQNRVNTGPVGSRYESMDNEVDITNLVINYDLGWGSITSSTSQLDYNAELDIDFSQLFFEAYYQEATTDTESFVQELRLSSSLEGDLQFIVGLYYEDKEENIDNASLWGGTATSPGFFGAIAFPLLRTETFEQTAFFGELSYDISDQLTATVGVRHFDYEIGGIESFNSGPFEAIPSADETGQSYKALLAYAPNEDMMVYGQWAEGFRPGKGLTPNITCAALGINDIPTQLDSDTTENIELGFKSSWADNQFVFNAALYRINWEGIPVSVNLGNNGAASCLVDFNAGKAVAEGIELEFQSRVTENLHVDISASYGETTLSGDSDLGNDGDNLPGSSDFNATLGIQYDFSLANNSSFARIDYSYISEYFNSVGSGTGQTPAGGFGQLNLKVGTQIDQVSADIFVDNLTNNDGLTWVETVFSGIVTDVTRANQIRPRTIGLNLRYQF